MFKILAIAALAALASGLGGCTFLITSGGTQARGPMMGNYGPGPGPGYAAGPRISPAEVDDVDGDGPRERVVNGGPVAPSYTVRTTHEPTRVSGEIRRFRCNARTRLPGNNAWCRDRSAPTPPVEVKG